MWRKSGIAGKSFQAAENNVVEILRFGKNLTRPDEKNYKEIKA
jgi:hypothetical protein